MSSVVYPAQEGEVVERAAPTLKPSKDARADRFNKLKLNGQASFTLDDDGSGADPVAAAQFAVDRQIEYHSVSDPSLPVKSEADGLDVLRSERQGN
jgi:hypothetical protein